MNTKELACMYKARLVASLLYKPQDPSKMENSFTKRRGGQVGEIHTRGEKRGRHNGEV